MDGLGTLKREDRQRSLPEVQDETHWKLVSYIWGMLDWRSLGDTPVGPWAQKLGPGGDTELGVTCKYKVSEALGWMSQGVHVNQEEKSTEEA